MQQQTLKLTNTMARLWTALQELAGQPPVSELQPANQNVNAPQNQPGGVGSWLYRRFKPPPPQGTTDPSNPRFRDDLPSDELRWESIERLYAENNKVIT